MMIARIPRMVYALSLTVFFSSCSGYVYFSKPQPVKVKKLRSFPEAWQGAYVGGNDTLHIEKKAICSVSHSLTKYALNDVAGQKIKSDIDDHPKEHESRYKIVGDSMEVDTRSVSRDKISRKNVVKPFGDKLALNQRTKIQDSWNTVIAEKKTDGTMVMYLAHMDAKFFGTPPGTNDSLATFEKICPIKPIDNDYSRTNFLCDPTAEQLQQLFDKGLFKPWEIYRKVN